MQDVMKDYRRSYGTYAEPLSGLRISWGSVLAGTTALLAVSCILLALALAIVSVASHPTVASLKGSAMALWVCAMGVTLVGAFVGGWLAGYLPGSTRPAIGMIHGFLAWALALILSAAFQIVILRTTLGAATNAAIDAAVALQSGQAAPDETQGANPGLGERPDQARRDAAAAGRTALNYVSGWGWSWFGTWFVAGLLAMAGASAGVARLRRSDFPDEPDYERAERDRSMRPLTPARG